MACEYWYNGDFRTEEEFKSILENGLIDQLISEGKVNLKDFELNKSLVKNKNVEKSPITLRITRHVQRNLNIDSREANEKNYQNPLNVFGEKMKLVVRVGDTLYAGKNKLIQKEINEKLNLEGAGELSIDSFEIGKVYALVESSYGLYPVQLFNNKIKDSTIKGDIFNALNELGKQNSKTYLEQRKFIEKKLYRTTVKYNEGKYIITKLEGTGEEITREFSKIEEAAAFLGEQLYRVDSLDINKKGYNETLANDGAIVTDTFLDNGNIFHSSSFQLEAYTTGNDTKENIEYHARVDGSSKISVANIAELEAKYEKNKEASTTNKSEETEGELFGKDAAQLQLLEKINEITNPALRKRLLSVLKNNSFIRPSDSKGNEVADGSDNHTHYVNTKTKKVLTRTTSYISEEEMTAETKNSPAVSSALTIGSKVDVLVRDFFAGTLKEEYNVASKEVVAGLIKQLEAIKVVMDKRGETVIPENIVLYNDEIGVAGTVDLLTFDKEGTVRIYDVKTMKNNEFIKNNYDEVPYDSKKKWEKTGEKKADGSPRYRIIEGAIQDSKREKHQKQLSMYRMLLNNTHGILADSLAVMPIKVGYKAPSAFTSELNLLKGVKVKPLNSIKDATITAPVKGIAEQSTEEAAEILAGFEQGEETESSQNEVTNTGDQASNPENKNLLDNLLNNSTGKSTSTDENEDIDDIDPSLRLREKKSKVIPNNGMSRERELEVLQQILGDAYKRQSGKKGTVRVFKDFETLKEYLPAKTYAMLLEARKNGQELYGLFTAAAILIQQNAPTGVAFHEAFHVIFNLALPVEDRVRILNEAYNTYKEDLPAVVEKDENGFVTATRLPNYLELEEYLADKYMEYVNSNGQLIETADVKGDGTQSKKKKMPALKKFFNAFSKMSQVFYSTKKVINIDNLFEDVTVGEYASKVQFRNTALDASVRQMSDNSGKVTNPDRKYVNKEAERQGFVALNHIINSQLQLAREKTNSKGELIYSEDLDDKGLISKIGVHAFITRIVHDLAETLVQYQNKAENATTAKAREYNRYIADNYMKLFNILTNNGTAVKQNKKTGLIEFSESTDLLERFLVSLQKRGLYIDYTNGTRTSDSTPEVLESDNVLEDDAINNLENGEETSDGVAMRNHIEVDPRESISQRLKTFFSQIPKLDSSYRAEKNSFGVQEFENPAEVFKFLISKVSNSYTMESMMQKLQAINKPYISDILDALENDPILQTHFWVSIGSRNYATYKTVYEKNGSYQVINSNRKDINNIVGERLISDFLDRANPLFVNKNIQELNQEEVAIFKAGIDEQIEIIKLIKNSDLPFNAPEQEDDQVRAVAEVIEKLSELFIKYKFNITEEELLLILNPPQGLTNYKTSLDNLYTTSQNQKKGLLNIVSNIIKQFEEGTNSFTSLTPTGEKSLAKGSRKQTSLVEDLAKAIIPAMQAEVVASFRNVNNKTAYNLIASGHLNKMITELQDPDALKDYLKEREEDALLSNLPYIEDLQDPDSDLMNTLETVILDGLSRQGKNKSVQYSKMSDIELEATSMGMFLNNGSKKEAFYKLGIPSDSPTLAYVKGIKHTTKEIQEKLLKTAEAEIKRIEILKNLPSDSELRLIPNYVENGKKFQILSFLNGKVDTSKPFVETQDAILKLIEDFTDSDNPNGLMGITIKKYLQAGVISEVTKDGAIVFAKGAIDKSFKNNTERKAFFENYILNTFYTSTQLNTIFAGDPSFYASTEDYQKRFKQIMSPGTYTTGTGTFNAVIGNDSIIPTTEMEFAQIKEVIDRSDISQTEKNEILGIWKDTLESKKGAKETGNNESDAGTYVSLARRKDILKGLGRWDEGYNEAFSRLEAGTETIEDLDLINNPLKPEKPFMFTKRFISGVEVPMQIKNAETVLTKSFALAEQFNKKTGKQEYKYPQLAAIYLDMNGGTDLNGNIHEAKYDTFIFESAVKVGGLGNKIDKNGDVRFSQYTQQADGSYQLEEGYTVMSLKEEDYRMQQETPPHYIDDRSNFGTQLRNLIIADLDLEGTYNIEGYSEPLTGAKVINLFQELVEEDLKESYLSTEKEFLDADENINWDRLLPILRKEALGREMGQEVLDAISSAEKTLGDTDNLTSPTVLPLFHPSVKYKMFALMNSIFKNRITKQKIKGGQLINTPSYGVSKDLKMKVKDGKIVYQALLPWTSREFFPTNEKGEVNIDFIKEHAPELLEIVANRVPTEDKYSMFSIEVVGFTPQSMGGTIILPPQATTVAGLDFDIDKLFFMQKAYRMKGKIPQVIRYISEITEDNIDQIANNLFSSHNSLKSFLQQSELDSELTQEILTRREELILANAKNKLGEKEIKKSPKFIDLTAKIEALQLRLQSTNLEEAKRKSIESEISETIAKLQEDFVPFDDAIEANDKLKENVIDVLKAELEKGNVNPVMFNGKAARDNQKISIIEGILRDPKTATSILHPGNFDSLKEEAAFIRLAQEGKIEEAEKLKGKQLIKKSKEADPKDFNINYPSTQLELFRRNMDGSDLIGIMANHNTHHAKAMHANVELNQEIYIDKVAYRKLDKKNNINGERISRLLATNLAAVVDNAKDPVASFLNMNTYTADTIAFLLRLGVPQQYIYLLINQPVILELTKLNFNEQGALSKEKIVNTITAKWQEILNKKFAAAGINTQQDIKDYSNRIGTTSRTLKKTIDGGEGLDYYVAQMNVLNKFKSYKAYGEELSSGVQAARVDTVGMGPTDANNYMQIARIQKLKDAELGKDGEDPTAKIFGLKDIVLGSPSIAQTMVPAFTKYSLLFPTSILNKIFPSIGAVKVKENTSDFSLQYSVLGKLKNKMAELTPTGSLTEKEANLIDNRFIDFISSGFNFFDYSKSKDIIDKMPDKVAQLKEKLKDPENKNPLKKYKYFLDQIYKVEANNTTPIARIEYYKTGKSPLDTERFTNTWELMLKDSDPEINKLTQDLVQYVYFANGYTFGPFSFANLIPVYFWSDKYQANNKEVNTKNKTFNQFLHKMFEETKFGATDLESVSELGQTTEDWEARFVDQFIRNFGDQGRFAATAKISEVYSEQTEAKGLAELAKRIEGKPGEMAERDIRTAGMAIASENKGIIKTSKGSLVVNIAKNPSLFKGRDNIPVQFIKVFTPNNKVYKAQYYKYHSDIDGTIIDPNLSEKSSKLDSAVYVPMPNLGLSNFLTEFNFFDDIKESLLKDISHLDVVDKNDLSYGSNGPSAADIEYMDKILLTKLSGEIKQSGGGSNVTYKSQGISLKTYRVEFKGQNYSIVVEDGSLKIFYRGVEGKQMNDVTSKFTLEQRRQIFLKQAIAAGTGTTVEYKGSRYGVNKQQEVFLLNTGKLVSWPKTSPAYMEVLELANKKLGKISNKNTLVIERDVSEVFKENPELEKIGTKEEYSKYLDTIFPDSKVKDIVYRGGEITKKEFEKRINPPTDFMDLGQGLYFSPKERVAAEYGDLRIALVNIKNPRSVKEVQDERSAEENFGRDSWQMDDGGKYDGIVDLSQPFKDTFELVIFNENQVYILGSSKDIKGFKNFVKKGEDTGSEKMSIETFKGEIKKIIDKKQQENFESEEAAEAFMNSESLQSAARIVKDPDIFNTVSQEELNKIISDLENC
jgi:hypothetical protein